ncbi:MAG: kelch repeat-containing protein, partial [Bacteroidota bacterium]|nr:kelch repeat-containing protein [Bacteroidota bacterium]
MLSTLAASAQKISPSVKWKFGAALPPSRGQSKSLGFAGVINGVSNNVLIVAGGANFPHGLPWEGGKKYYSDEIHVLQKDGVNFLWNKKVINKLPEPIAYCGSTSTDRGIAYVGGENENGISNRCHLLRWNNQKDTVDIEALPNLPIALTNIALTHIGNTLYAVGGDEEKISSNSFYSLNLDDAEPQWQKL